MRPIASYSYFSLSRVAPVSAAGYSTSLQTIKFVVNVIGLIAKRVFRPSHIRHQIVIELFRVSERVGCFLQTISRIEFVIRQLAALVRDALQKAANVIFVSYLVGVRVNHLDFSLRVVVIIVGCGVVQGVGRGLNSASIQSS